MIDTYFGTLEAWEADTLGHTNMRFYVERIEQARALFCIKLGLGQANRQGALSTLIPLTQHARYHREIHPGETVRCKTGIVTGDDKTVTLVHEIYKSDNRLSFTLVEVLAHISTRTGKAFVWPKRAFEYILANTEALPVDAQPRNILSPKPDFTPTIKRAKKMGLQIIGSGMFGAHEARADGYIRGFAIFGRISDSVSNLRAVWPETIFGHAPEISAALLEKRVHYHSRPKVGECYILYSGLRAANANVREMGHWMMDPDNGRCYATIIGAACTFNLQTRRLVKMDEKKLNALTPFLTPELSA